jgi:RNA polymerase sigma-70 factor, ECF subfamily
VLTTDESELVQRAQGGDETAFEELWVRYRVRVHARIRNIINNNNDIQDVGQEVLLKIYKGLPRFRGTCKFITWVYPIVTHACGDYLRRARRAARVFVGDVRTRGERENEKEERRNQTEDQLCARDEYSRYLAKVRRQDYTQLCLAVARSVLEETRPRKRKVIRLLIQEGYSAAELAEMGIVKNRAQATQIVHDFRERCRQVLREVLVNRQRRSTEPSRK